MATKTHTMKVPQNAIPPSSIEGFLQVEEHSNPPFLSQKAFFYICIKTDKVVNGTTTLCESHTECCERLRDSKIHTSRPLIIRSNVLQMQLVRRWTIIGGIRGILTRLGNGDDIGFLPRGGMPPGHLMFEMVFGYELDSAEPAPRHLVNCQNIFTIQISEHNFFRHLRLQEIDNPTQVPISPAVKSLLKSVKKGKLKKSASSQKLTVKGTAKTKRKRKSSDPPPIGEKLCIYNTISTTCDSSTSTAASTSPTSSISFGHSTSIVPVSSNPAKSRQGCFVARHLFRCTVEENNHQRQKCS
ncbi:hypothetical protein ScPMuIL_007728 [Solemya velum]